MRICKLCFMNSVVSEIDSLSSFTSIVNVCLPIRGALRPVPDRARACLKPCRSPIGLLCEAHSHDVSTFVSKVSDNCRKYC